VFFSTLDGKKVNSVEYKSNLAELMDICLLCNDSGLAYNEVKQAAFFLALQETLKHGCFSVGSQQLREDWGAHRSSSSSVG